MTKIKAQIIKMTMATKTIQISNKAITRMMANKTLTTINKATTKKMTTQILTKIRKTTTSITTQVKIKTAMMTRRIMINPEMANMITILMMIHKTRLVAKTLAMALLVLEKILVKVVKINLDKEDIVVAKIILDMATTPVAKASQDKEINRGRVAKIIRVTSQVMTKMIDQATNQVRAIIKVDKPIRVNLRILHIKVATQEDKILNRANLLKVISRQGQVRKAHINILNSHLDLSLIHI